MTCQHCQTWILDDDHRCRRCGRRVRTTPSRISPATYPIAAAATAPALDFSPVSEPRQVARIQESVQEQVVSDPQRTLFAEAEAVNAPRVIAFDSLTSPAERDAIRIRAREIPRPAPLKNEKIEVPRARAKRAASGQQRPLDFLTRPEIQSSTPSQVICDAPVGAASLRFRAALIDALLIACGYAVGIALFLYVGGSFPLGKHEIPFLVTALATVPLFYKLLWAFADRDTVGTRAVGLQLVDFDGNAPGRARRYQRLAGSVLSLLAAGVGLIWVFVDEDSLTWHDHISCTFPTFSIES